MRGSDDATVDPKRLAAAHALDFTLLQDAQERGQNRRGWIADLVQKYAATRSRLKAPHLVSDGSGEGAANVTEELTLEQAL